VEAGVACAKRHSRGLLALCLTARNQPARAVVVIFLATALAVHSFGIRPGGQLPGRPRLGHAGALYGVAAQSCCSPGGRDVPYRPARTHGPCR